MLSIQQGLESVTEHLTEGTQLVDKLQQPEMDSQSMVYWILFHFGTQHIHIGVCAGL